MQRISKSKVLIIMGMVLLTACDNQSEITDAKPLKGDSVSSPVSCYLSVNNRDTVRLKTVKIGNTVTGTLDYNYYQKDKNNGTIVGEMKGELLVVDYRFTSEGMQSSRQVVFKKQEEQFVEGYGAAEEIGGKTKFRNIDSLDFSHSIPLQPIDCPSSPIPKS